MGVIPAQAGIFCSAGPEIPACAGMTEGLSLPQKSFVFAAFRPTPRARYDLTNQFIP